MGNRVNWKKKIFFEKERTGKVSQFITFLISAFFFFSSCHITFKIWLLRKAVGRKQRKVFCGPPAVFTGESIAALLCVPSHPASSHSELSAPSRLLFPHPDWEMPPPLPSPHPITPPALATPPTWPWQVCCWYALEPRSLP